MVLTHIKQNHSCVSVEEVAEKHREILESSCATLDEKLSEGKKALNNITGVMKSLEENASAAKEKIVEQANIIAKVVSDQLVGKAKEMCGEVDDIHDELHTELSQQHDEIKEYVDKVQGSFSRKERFFDIMVYYSKRFIDYISLTREKINSLLAKNHGHTLLILLASSFGYHVENGVIM
jgi:prefoldin subunit 5